MIAQPLGSAVAAASRDGLEHVGHLPRIVSGACHDLRAKQVRFALVATAVLHEVRAEANLRPLGDRAAGTGRRPSIRESAPRSRRVETSAPWWPSGSVPQHDVTEFVRHHACHLAVVPAASSIPRFRNIGPPGSANALISRRSTTWNVYRNPGCRSLPGIAATSRAPMRSTYACVRPSRTIGSSSAKFGRRTSAKFDVLSGRESIAVRIDARLRRRGEGQRHAGDERENEAMVDESHAHQWGKPEAKSRSREMGGISNVFYNHHGPGVLAVGQPFRGHSGRPIRRSSAGSEDRRASGSNIGSAFSSLNGPARS